MKNKKDVIGIISGTDLVRKRSGKLNKSDAIVQSGTGYHKDKNKYNRKAKKNQQLKNQLKAYGLPVVFLHLKVI